MPLRLFTKTDCSLKKKIYFPDHKVFFLYRAVRKILKILNKWTNSFRTLKFDNFLKKIYIFEFNGARSSTFLYFVWAYNLYCFDWAIFRRQILTLNYHNLSIIWKICFKFNCFWITLKIPELYFKKRKFLCNKKKIIYLTSCLYVKSDI